jgi:hypothetical protein
MFGVKLETSGFTPFILRGLPPVYPLSH